MFSNDDWLCSGLYLCIYLSFFGPKYDVCFQAITTCIFVAEFTKEVCVCVCVNIVAHCILLT